MKGNNVEQPTQEELKDAVMIVSLFLFHLKLAPKKSASTRLKNPALCGPIDTHTWASWLKPDAKPSCAILMRFTAHIANRYAVIKCWDTLCGDRNNTADADSNDSDASRIVAIVNELKSQPWSCLHKWYSNNSDSTYRLLRHLNNEKTLGSLEREKNKLDSAIKSGFGVLYQILSELIAVIQKSENAKKQKDIVLAFIEKKHQQEVKLLNKKDPVFASINSSSQPPSTEIKPSMLGYEKDGGRQLYAAVSSNPVARIIFYIVISFVLMAISYFLYVLSPVVNNDRDLIAGLNNASSIKHYNETAFSSVDTLRQQRVISEVERIRSKPPLITSKPSDNRILVESVPEPTIANVELIDYWVIWDLRNLKKLSSLDRTQMLSPAVKRVRQRVKKIANIDNYRVPAYTSGLDIYSRSDSLPLTVYASEERSNIAAYPVKPRMLEFDVSGVALGDEFFIDVSKTYWNAFQNDDQTWLGVTTELSTLSINFLVVFPEDRPYKQLNYFASDKNKKRIDVDNAKYVVEGTDKTWVSWHIDSPKAHHGYHIGWEW